MIRAVIVDDEADAIESMRTVLEWYCAEEIEVVGDANDLGHAVRLIEELGPQLVFLDVEMGKENGFMLLERLQQTDPSIQVIFTTGHAAYAIHALRKRAFDYLLKPIDPDDLKAAVRRLKDELGEEGQNAVEPIDRETPETIPPPLYEPTLSVPMRDQVRILKVSQIIRAESDRNYTRFHLTGEPSILVSRHLGSFEAQLLPYNFFRPHKSHLINLAFLKSYVRQEGGYILMEGDAEVPLARGQRAALFKLLNI